MLENYDHGNEHHKANNIHMHKSALILFVLFVYVDFLVFVLLCSFFFSLSLYSGDAFLHHSSQFSDFSGQENEHLFKLPALEETCAYLVLSLISN